MKRKTITDDGRVVRVRATSNDAPTVLRMMNLQQRLSTPGAGPLLSDRERDIAMIAILDALGVLE